MPDGHGVREGFSGGTGQGNSGRWVRAGRTIVVLAADRQAAAVNSRMLEFEDGPEPQWPARTRFNPDFPSIPAGPFKTTPVVACQQLRVDAAGLRDMLSSLNKSIAVLEGLKNARPRNQDLWDESARTLQRQLASVKAALTGMLERVRAGTYKQGGCTLKDFAVVTEQVRKLELRGGWKRHRGLCDLRNQLVFRLRQARGAFRLPGATGTPNRPVVCT